MLKTTRIRAMALKHGSCFRMIKQGSAGIMVLMVLLAMCIFFAAPTSAAQLSLCPANPHYFQFKGQPTVLITSAEHYGAVVNRDFNYDMYFDELQAHRFNHTRLFSGMFAWNYGDSRSPLNVANGRLLTPWARSATPGYANGGNKFNLNAWDESGYFPRLRDYIVKASAHGIVVEVVLFCVMYDNANWSYSPLHPNNNVNGIPVANKEAIFDVNNSAMMAVEENMVKKIVSELKGYDNVYYELCNEPYMGVVSKAWHQRIISAIRSVDANCLIAQNIANGSSTIGTPLAGVSVFNYHYASPPTAVALNFGLNKPIAFDETGFIGSVAESYRSEAWKFILAGGAVYSNLDWSYSVASPNGYNTVWDKTLGGGGDPLRKYLTVLKDFIGSFDFSKLKPDNGLVTSGPGGASRYVLAEPGQQYAVYFFSGGQGNAVMTVPAGTYSVEWVNIANGSIDKSQTVTHAGSSLTLASPAYSSGIALRVKRTGSVTPALSTGPIAYWKLNETSGTTASDASGNGNTATLVNGPAWLAAAKVNSGLSFDGVNDYITTPSSASLNSLKSQMTLTAWVRKKADAPTYGVLLGRQQGTGYYDLWTLYFNNSSQDEYSFGLTTSAGKFSVTGPSSVGDLNAWVHVAGVYNGSQISLYLNGVAVNSTPCTGTIPDEITPVIIGAGDNGTSSGGIKEYSKADLDDICIYNRALSTSEISNLYNPLTMGVVQTGLETEAIATEALSLSAKPNPFNPTTTFMLHGIKGAAQLTVYNMAGRKVADLGSQTRNPSVTWDASLMPSGAYVVCLVNNGKSLTRKVVLAK